MSRARNLVSPSHCSSVMFRAGLSRLMLSLHLQPVELHRVVVEQLPPLVLLVVRDDLLQRLQPGVAVAVIRHTSQSLPTSPGRTPRPHPMIALTTLPFTSVS